jgi:hypothetical protein
MSTTAAMTTAIPTTTQSQVFGLLLVMLPPGALIPVLALADAEAWPIGSVFGFEKERD